MNQTKYQFYATWIIFGYAVYFGINQLLRLVGELLISAAIQLNADPFIVKYSRIFFYAVILVAFVIVSIRIIKSEKQPSIDFKPRKLRLPLGLLVILGIISQLGVNKVSFKRMDQVVPYLEKHDITPVEFYSDFITSTAIPNILLFVAIMIVFFVLTNKKS